jgi:hypothetical protein
MAEFGHSPFQTGQWHNLHSPPKMTPESRELREHEHENGFMQRSVVQVVIQLCPPQGMRT